jgi:hypothetical protein
MPIDTIKTSLQVDGKTGLNNVMNKAKTTGISAFYHGSLASAGIS